MTHRSFILLTGAALALAASSALAFDSFHDGVSVGDSDPGTADLFVNDVTVLDGKVCIGENCVQTETFNAGNTVKLKALSTHIFFDDTSTLPNYPDRDWRIMVNDDQLYGADRFSVEDITAGTIPFTIEGGAPASALYVAANGRVGLGTALPADQLHVAKAGYPAIRLEQTGPGWTPWTWRLVASDAAFAIYDLTSGTSPFTAETAANTSLFLSRSGWARLSGTLQVTGSEDRSQIIVSETNATTTPRALLSLSNNGRPEIVMANSNTSGEWSFGAGTNFILKQGALESSSAEKTKILEINPSGDATLTGTLTTGGTTCGAGCDAVFKADYQLPSIADHAAQMQALGYLPNVGPTPEGAPIDLTDKLGRMLNELEHAHLYIARQEDRIATLESDLATVHRRLEALER